MAISDRLRALLDTSKVKYTIAKHPIVYTAQEIAAAQHVPGRHLAKCVLVKTDRGPHLAVLPASFLVDLKRLKTVLGVNSIVIAKESDIKATFPDIEVGAMSPFGNLYHIPVVIDRMLEAASEIVFNAGTHTETIKMRYQDVVALAKPKTGSFAQDLGGKKKKTAKAKKTGKKTGKKARSTTKRTSRAKHSLKKRR